MFPISDAIPRTALVTGAAKRLGQHIALVLAQAGFDLALHCHQSQAEAEALAKQIMVLGRRAVILPADLSHETEMAGLVARAAQALGAIGVLVNNASTFVRDEWDNANRESWDLHIEPNLRAPFVLMQNFAKSLPKDARGVAINMLDQRVWAPTPHFVSYTVSKAGLWALTQSMALALAPRIRVCAIGPGPTLPSGNQTPEQFARQTALMPLGHGASADEIGRAVHMILALPSFTGQMIALDGGQHLNWSPAPSTLTSTAP